MIAHRFDNLRGFQRTNDEAARVAWLTLPEVMDGPFVRVHDGNVVL